MDKQLFDTLMNETYATYGKPAPRQPVLDAAFKQVEALPDEFMLWAAEQLQDSDRLPANIGRELRKGLYPSWRASQMVAFSEEQVMNDLSGDPACPDCGGKGWHYVWRWNAKPGTAATAIPCLCNMTADAFPDVELRKASSSDLLANGWVFDEPPVARTRPPKPLKRSLQEMLESLRRGRGVYWDNPPDDPRRKMPEEYL